MVQIVPAVLPGAAITTIRQTSHTLASVVLVVLKKDWNEETSME